MLEFQEALKLYQNEPLLELGRAAYKEKKKRHKYTTFVVDRNINYTNVCVSGCKFCAFKKEKAANYNEIKTKKRFWKKIDKPKELATDRKVHKRMRKNLKKAERINKNKHQDNFLVRLSRKKIKLPQISKTKIHWPWTKKSSSE